MNAETRSYRRYVLFILTLVYVFNFVDRQILVILQEPIKAELGLSDTQRMMIMTIWLWMDWKTIRCCKFTGIQ
jgi:hypothetical protein